MCARLQKNLNVLALVTSSMLSVVFAIRFAKTSKVRSASSTLHSYLEQSIY